MKWKLLLVVFFVSLAGILIGNLTIVSKIDLNPIHFFQNSPVFNRRVKVISDIKNISPNPSSPSPNSSNPSTPALPSSVSISEKNSTLLNSYLSDLNFFGKSAVRLREGSETWVTVSKLNIHLTGGKYKFNNFTETDLGYLRSTSENFSNGVLDLYVGMNPNYYFNGKYDSKKASQAFESQVFLALFSLTKPDEYMALKELSTSTLPKELNSISALSLKTPIFEFKTN